MKIMLLLSSLNAGGAERVAASLANAWVAKGYQIVLVPTFTQGNGVSFYPLDERVKVSWLCHDLPKNKLLGKASKPLYLRRLIKREQPDVLVSFLTNVNVMSLLASLGLNIPLVVSERSHPLHQKISASLKTLRKRLYPLADVVMLQTQQAADEFAQAMPPLKSLEVLPNPLPIELCSHINSSLEQSMEQPIEQSMEQSTKRIVAMGRLVPSKQFDLLIHVFVQASKQEPGWTLHIYGDGPERERLQQLIKSLQKEDLVFLEGKTSEPWHKMREAQIFAMTSKLEGFPNVMLEAMALGLPVVAFDCPSGPREISEHGQFAHIIPLGNDKEYETALLRLMQDEEYRQNLAQRGRQHVLAHYAQEQVLAQWDALFQRLLAKRSNNRN